MCIKPNLCVSDGWTPLHSAARWDQAEMSSLLLSQGANVNEKTNGGLTAIQLAASEKGYEKVLSVLLSGTISNFIKKILGLKVLTPVYS